MDAVRTESTTPRRRASDDVLSIVDDVLANNPWVRLGVSTAVGFLVGIVGGGRVLRTGARFAFAAGARYAARHAFDLAFEAGHRDGSRRAGVHHPAATDHATERSY